MIPSSQLTKEGGLEKKSFQVSGYDIRLTCEAFPEQYDVLRKGLSVGYIRLRHGCLNVWCPDAGMDSDRVYFADVGYGEFYNDAERYHHMELALMAIDKWYKANMRRKG